MSEMNTPQATLSANANDAKQAKGRAPRGKSTFSVTDLARLRLRARGIKSDARLTDECKVVRGILRSNFTDVRKNDASVRKAKDAANDRRPWPTNMNAHTRDIVLGKRAGK
jgi:hypothetical protein